MPIKTTYIYSVIFFLFLYGSSAYAELSLNFSVQGDGYWTTSAGTPFIERTVYRGSSFGRGPVYTPEVVIDPETGLDYWHVVIGDPTTGFMQETFIERGFSGFWNGGEPGSASGGFGAADGGNGRDPLDQNDGIGSGNGSANPKRTLIRQIVTDGELYSEFVKDKFFRKPLIIQVLNTSEIFSSFEMDMRNSSYDDDTTAGIMSNVLVFSDPSLEMFGAGFNSSTDLEDSLISAGRYTFSDGSSNGGTDGTYSYIDGGFDHVNQSWEIYFDKFISNPWTYASQGNKPE